MAYTTIDDPEAYFQTVIYTGNGSANLAITLPGDTDMQPDLVWIKNRDSGDDGHCLFDAVRGATEVLASDSTAAESDDDDTLDSFASDGFQVDADIKVNTNTEKYVAWCWKESATSGFDIVSYTVTGSAKTESHSLSAVPHVIICKNRTDADSWRVYHHKNTSAPETDHLILDESGATADDATTWNDTAPTSSVFSVGTSDQTNENTDSFIAYLWTEKQGFSKFGIYIGNANDDGTFIYTGFRPAYVMLKRTGPSYGEAWNITDNKRVVEHNPTGYFLYANATGAEVGNTTHSAMDLLSNGFKLRDAHSQFNDGNYIYMAFAEAPFVNSNGVPCNAR